MNVSFNFRSLVEATITTSVILLIWGVLSLPIIFFHLRGRFQVAINFPDCNTFPPESEECQNMFSNSTTLTDFDLGIIGGSQANRQCSEDFFRDNQTGTCIPSCHSWSQFSKSQLLVSDVIFTILCIVALIATIISALLSCIGHKQLIKFPTVYIFYMNMDVAVTALLYIISIAGRKELHCHSRSLLESLQIVTPYCIISGIIFTYTTFQQLLWWKFYVLAYFWSSHFPFHYRSYDLASKTKYFHLVSVILGLLIPTVPILAIMGNFAMENEFNGNESYWSRGAGFAQITFPNNYCIGRDENVVHYSYILPIVIIVALGCSLLALIIRLLIKQRIRRSKVQDKTFQLGTVEKKLLFLICYYVLIVTMALISVTLAGITSREQINSQRTYFICELSGYDPEDPCSRSDIERQNNLVLTFTSIVLLSLMPVFLMMIYAIQMKTIKLHWKKLTSLPSSTKSSNNTELQQVNTFKRLQVNYSLTQQSDSFKDGK